MAKVRWYFTDIWNKKVSNAFSVFLVECSLLCPLQCLNTAGDKKNIYMFETVIWKISMAVRRKFLSILVIVICLCRLAWIEWWPVWCVHIYLSGSLVTISSHYSFLMEHYHKYNGEMKYLEIHYTIVRDRLGLGWS